MGEVEVEVEMETVTAGAIEIKLNGEPYSLERGASIEKLLQQLSMAEKRLAVEVNREIIPRSQYANTLLHGQDRVEIVIAIGGG